MTAETLPIISVFERSPDRGKGLARDMRARWALEEVGKPYDVRPVTFAALAEPAHRILNPFGQIPTYEDGDLTLFESGAIVFHIASNHTGLLPEEAVPRARAINWMFAALSTLEPPIVEREVVLYNEHGETSFDRRLHSIEERIRVRLSDLSRRLGSDEWLVDKFSAGDLLTVDVLRRLVGSGLLDEFPNLPAYVTRAENRPAFKRAFDAQRTFFLNAAAQ